MIPVYVAFVMIFIFVLVDKANTSNVIKGQQKTIADLTKKFMAKNLAELARFEADEKTTALRVPAVAKAIEKAGKEQKSAEEQLAALRDIKEIVD
jgi:hypothetical protein